MGLQMTAIHQFVISMVPGDAITNEALAMKEVFRSWGYESEVYAGFLVDNKLEKKGKFISKYRSNRNTLTIYHFSIGCKRATRVFLHAKGKKGIIYHNITPTHFLSPYMPLGFKDTISGRDELASLVSHCDLSMADSEYNADDLRTLGFKNIKVLPLLMDLHLLKNTEPDSRLYDLLCNGRKNFIFTGRLVPNKRQEDVIRAFAWYHRYIDRYSRLVLVGIPVSNEYVSDLREVARSLGVDDSVLITGHVTLEQLVAVYRTADLFLSMSEHEGFCVPIVEAMLFDIPVLAFAAGGVPGTLGKAGVIVNQKDFPVIAEMAHQMLEDREFRSKIIKTQRDQLEVFSPKKVKAQLKSYVEDILS